MLWCWRPKTKRRHGPVAVHLSVYDLTPVNGYGYWIGLGVFHSGVEVHGVEYAYGAHEQSTTGIFEAEPRQCEGFTLRKSVLVGWTDMSRGEVKRLMEELGRKYRGDAYNLIGNNCNHFCDDACIKLTGKSIPRWVNRLARIGMVCNCMVPMSLSSTKVGGSNKVGDKESEVEKKKLSKSRSNGLLSSSSASSSSSSLDS